MGDRDRGSTVWISSMDMYMGTVDMMVLVCPHLFAATLDALHPQVRRIYAVIPMIQISTLTESEYASTTTRSRYPFLDSWHVLPAGRG